MSTRRDVLAALLGVPTLAAFSGGCCRRGVPSGEIAGADVTLGHRLRELPPEPNASVERTPILIIGGGVAGLSAGWRLLGSPGTDFILVELESEAGGTSRSSANSTTAYPWGAHYVPLPSRDNRPLVRLLSEIGVVSQPSPEHEPIPCDGCLVTEPEERVFYRGKWHEGLLPDAALTPRDRKQLEEFRREVARWVGYRDSQGRRAFAVPMALGSDDPEVTALDALSMGAWMDRHGFSSPPLRWYVDFACRDDYGCSLDTTSAWAGLFYFVARVPRPGAESAPFLTWPEGNGRVVRHLREIVGDRFRSRQLACDVLPENDGVRVRLIDARLGLVRTVIAERVILAVPRFIAGRLLRPWRDQPPPEVTEFETAPWLVANLALRERPRNRGFVPAWDNVLFDSPSLGYVLATHQLGRRFGPTVLTYYYALTDANPKRAREKLLSTTREEWVEVILTDLGRAHPEIGELVDRVDLFRWGHAMVRPRPGFVWSDVRRRAARILFDRIHVACTDLSGIPLLEEALFHGVRAAEEVLDARGQRGSTWL